MNRKGNCMINGDAISTYSQASTVIGEHGRKPVYLGAIARTVFCGGVFDILHPGHCQMLRRAKELGGRLIVGLNTDVSVRRLKGPRRPVNCYEHRRDMLLAIRWVDEVVPIVGLTPIELIERLRPDVVVKGRGYQKHRLPETLIVESYGGQVVILDGPDISTTQLLQKWGQHEISDRPKPGDAED